MIKKVLVGIVLACLMLGMIPINSAEETQVSNLEKWNKNEHYYQLIKKDFTDGQEAKEYAENKEIRMGGEVYKGHLACFDLEGEDSWIAENIIHPSATAMWGNFWIEDENGEPYQTGFGKSWGEAKTETYILIEYSSILSTENHRPILTDEDLKPESGNPSSTFEFSVAYKDEDGDEPIDAYVRIIGFDGTKKVYDETKKMKKVGGEIMQGATYSYSTILPAGEYCYYFYFNDGHDHNVYLPSGGYPGFDGPYVGLEIEDWWSSEEGIANFAQLLNEKYNGKAWWVHQKGNYILILIAKGANTKKITWKYIDGTIHSMDIDIPEYHSFLFDKQKEDFIPGEGAKAEDVKYAEDKVIEIYLENYLKGAKDWGFVYSDHISSTSDDLLSRKNHPWVLIGGPLTIQLCNSGKALATFLVTKHPGLAGKTYMNAQKKMIVEIGDTAFEKAELEGSEWGKTAQDLIEGYKKIRDARIILKQYRLVKIAKRLKEAGELYENGRCLTDIAFAEAANVVGEHVFPTEAVTATTVYYGYSGEKAYAAKELAKIAKSDWSDFKKDPTRDNYINTYSTLIEAYYQLALGYEFQARAIERNRGGITGFFAENIHNCLNQVKVQENINNLRCSSENMEDWELLMYLNVVRPLYWTDSAATSLQYPNIDFSSIPKEAEIVSCAVNKYGEEVEATVEVANHKSITYTYTLGFRVRSPQGQIFNIPTKEVTLEPEESKKLSLSWKIPSDAPSGPYDATTALWEEDFSRNYDRWGWKSGQFIVDSVNAKISSCNFDSGKYDYKDIVEASVKIKNHGEDQRFLIKVSLKDERGSPWDMSESYVQLNYGEEVEVPLHWTIDENTPEGTYLAVIELKYKGIVKDSLKKDNVFEVVLTNLPPKVYRDYPTTRYLPLSEGSALTFKVSAEDRDGHLKLIRWLLNLWRHYGVGKVEFGKPAFN